MNFSKLSLADCKKAKNSSKKSLANKILEKLKAVPTRVEAARVVENALFEYKSTYKVKILLEKLECKEVSQDTVRQNSVLKKGMKALYPMYTV